jgi:hypothetical protein
MLDAIDRPDDAGGVEAPEHVKVTSLAILGSHPATVMQTPFHDESWEIWSCSPHNVELRVLPRVTAWCELHDPVFDPSRNLLYLKAVSEMPFVWMRDKSALASGKFPGGRLYPEDEVRATFNPFALTSSIAYMLALGILECERRSLKQIGIFGVIQAAPNEYTYQRPGIQYFIWEATKRGIKVIAPRESNLFEPPQEKW